MSETADKGQPVAHTPAKTSEPGPVTAGRAALKDDFAALAARLAAADQAQPDLLDGSPDLDDTDLLSMAARTANEGRRVRGRPLGSQNKRNADVFDYLASLGHRDPAVTLSLIQSADIAVLARELWCTRAEAVQLQLRAAAELMPFKYAKRPQAIEVTKRELHLFVAGDYNTALPVDQGGAIDITNGAHVIDNGEE